ncbi:MAG: hypothetical protein K9N09_09435 [Candidatus Cloacimonetes bacterium]|nr:hypothetical protein [Candidatus Cloacimonadota bacterium]MCF7813878.1 hypothetical protein [Candidatus Cloacimonadota bacterium]MCF7868911.1 hypothetical protein [Candidatus Cloacimonadota bacterium]MCF7883990.1 hypothetical protein [Candidatus Cloacimonadota bacterium]
MLSEQILKTAEQESDLHPKATLIDFYKLFFQAVFGPGHFIKNEEAAKIFLQQELASAKSFEDYLYQKITCKKTFYRVNLKVVKQKLVCQKDFLQGFLRSSRFKSEISYQDWASEWKQIESFLKKSSLKITDFEEASRQLERNFKNRKYVISHSQIYRESYFPHYRLFTEKEFIKFGLEK